MTARLRKTRTMVKTSEEGTSYLKRTWGEERLTVVQKAIDTRHDLLHKNNKNSDDEKESIEPPKKKVKFTKNRTMTDTATEGKSLLKNASIDIDARTRNQSKAIKELTKESNANKTSQRKVALKKHATMKATAKEANELLKGEKLANTRAQSNAKKLNAKKPKLTKSRTMKQTAKEGKAFIKSFKSNRKQNN